MGLKNICKQLLSDPTPVFATFDAVHGHFANAILFRQFLDGDLPVFVVKHLLDAFNLVRILP